jgi:ATP/maltotriose-dependent transcriptional regulator MalT
MKDVESILATEVEPLRALALLVIGNLDAEIRYMCEKLSVTESFTLELAREILGDKFSYERVNEVAQRGEIFSISRDPEAGFIFSPMMREIFTSEFGKREAEKLELHERMTDYFIGRGEPGLALEQAFQAGNTEKIKELFPSAARVKQAKGQGDDLIRWAVSVNDGTVDGELGKSTIEIAGFLANLNFDLARAQLSRLALAAHSSANTEFYSQFVAGGESYLNLAFGRFDEVEACIGSSRTGHGDCYLGIDDQISLLRVLATKRYIWNDSEKVDEVFAIAEQLGKQTVLTTSHTFLLSMQAMSLHLRGEFQKAFDIAANALAQYKRHGYVGNHGPLDVLYVKARCLLEFSRIDEAIAIFEQIRNLAFQWKQWHWYLTAENHILQELMNKGQKTQALERIKSEREFIQGFDAEHKLEAFIDINELYPRFVLNDLNRLEVLVSRTPQTRDVLQYKLFIDGSREIRVVAKEVANLSERTPRDLIWKHLSLAINNIGSESIAFKHVEQALKVGSTVGARETFLRQIDQIGNLILKVANQSPTIYNESLASAMAERMRERGDAVTEGIPALTKRELEILRQLSTGRTLSVIAGELHISQNTMKTHLKNLYKKLGADGRADAVEKAKGLFLL